MQYQYFFIPGRQRNLSLAELKSVFQLFPANEFVVNSKPEQFFLLRTNASEEIVNSIFYRLGGYIKYGKIVDLESEEFLPSLIEDKKSIRYGISEYLYDKEAQGDIAVPLAHKLKKYFKSMGLAARFIGEKNRLSAGSIIQNNLLNEGFELCLLKESDTSEYIGQTLAVQDIEGYSFRDYKKPSADKEMGMLPPKLARIMINLAGIRPGETIWDPFCGSGVILMEALLLGYNVIGSDILGEAVASSENNIKWLGENYDTKELRFKVFPYNINNEDQYLLKQLRQTNIKAAIFEPYMGPPQRKRLSPHNALELIDDVTKLLKSAFDRLEVVLPVGGKVVAIVPSYLTYEGWMDPKFNEFLNKNWEIHTNKKHGKDLHWSRSNSIITRNILVTELKRK